MSKFALVFSLASLAASQSVFAADYPAKHCELFVDQVAAWNSTYGYSGMTLKIKTINERLDGAVKEVGFRSIVRSTPQIKDFCQRYNPDNGYANDCYQLDQWVDRPAREFFGPDYFRIDLVLKHDYTFEHVFEGAFYVKTDKGTRYWLNPAGEQNFFVDRNMYQNLLDLGSGGYYMRGREISTADKFKYLNPGGCR